jgi:hypothetical protein
MATVEAATGGGNYLYENANIVEFNWRLITCEKVDGGLTEVHKCGFIVRVQN